MKTEAALSTQILIGLFLQKAYPLESTIKGRTNSIADMALLRDLLAEVALPKLIALDQGTYAHQEEETAPTPETTVRGGAASGIGENI